MKKFFCGMVSVLAFVLLSINAHAAESVWQKTEKVNFTGGSRTVNAVYVDLKDKTLRIEAVPARKQIGKVDELKNIAAQESDTETEVIAAINGTFFEAYTDKQPSGTLEYAGEYLHFTNTGSAIAFTTDNKAIVDNLYVSIKGSINGSWEYPNTWEAYALNHKVQSSDLYTVFTPEYGDTTGAHTSTSIVVDRGTVKNIRQGEAEIPDNGFTVVIGNSTIVKRFHIGDKVDYKLEFNRIDFSGGGRKKGAALQWENIRSVIGAGPTLVKNGAILADGKKEGFKEDKINTNQAQRSFAGITKDNILILGTVANVSVKELAQIALKLGAVNAINLDGGASSGLYYRGRYLTAPGRQLSNALVVTRLKEVPLRVKLNGKEMVLNSDPYVLKPQNASMIPMEEVFKVLGAAVAVENQGKKITITVNNKKAELSLDSDAVKVNGTPHTLAAPLRKKNGIIYIPAKFINTLFGGKFGWDGTQNAVLLDIGEYNPDNVFEQAKKYEISGDLTKAESLYLQVLDMNPKHAGAHQKLALMYRKASKNDLAIKHYNLYLSLNPDDHDSRSILAWAYYSISDFNKAIECFIYLTKAKPKESYYWTNLGDIYMDSRVREYDKAEAAYKKALSLGVTKEKEAHINSRLKQIDGLRK